MSLNHRSLAGSLGTPGCVLAAILAVPSASLAVDIHVPGDQSTIQAGIDAAVNGDVVIVAVGLYFENINFNGKAITVRSTDPNDAGVVQNTIINGTGFYHVVQCVSGEGPDTVLSGFVITGGNANGISPHDRGGGMVNGMASNPTVNNCIFRGNSANTFGGGMYNVSNSPTVTNCSFIGNTAGNQGGGGMYNSASYPTVTNCTFSENRAGNGGGMYNTGGSGTTTVTNCTFSGNTADTGDGGGMFNFNSSPAVINCTFIDNSAVGPDSGGGMFSFVSPTVTNCILWGNTPDQISSAGSPTVTYTDVQGGFAGTGNINTDPLFVDPLNSDYRLSAGSSCIDAANNIAVPVGITTDLDGNPRFVDDPATADTGFGTPPIIDMGAYEFQGASPCPWDCQPVPEGTVGIVDFLSLLSQWGSSGSCDFDGGVVGITDFLALLGNWGPCP